jgi:SMODS and SLOG-associating 2TM effector domain 2
MPSPTTEHTAGTTADASNLDSLLISGSRDTPKGLEEIYDALVRKASSAMVWYETRQREKKRGARGVRTVAIILGALTAIIPSLIALLPERIHMWGMEFSALKLNPLATIVGVAAATVILFDRFYGFSSSWMRYVTTYQDIQSHLEEFTIGWRKEILKLNSNQPPTDEQIIAIYDYLLAFLKSINDAVRAETQSWVTEFKGTLGDIDKTVESQKTAAAAAAALPAKGALNITVADYRTLDEHRWTLQIDNRKEEIKIGQPSASIPLLDPGIYKVRIAGLRAKEPVAAELAVIVKPGDITTLPVEKLG